MKLSVKGLALACAALWGGAVFLASTCNLVWPGYGEAFLDLARSIYPGYGGTQGAAGVLVGTLYAVVDGLIGGAVFAWIYNYFAALDGTEPGATSA